MPYYKYLGEIHRSYVRQYGPTTKIRLHLKNGTVQELTNPEGFPIGEIIPTEITDERAVRAMDADPRFERAT